MKKIIFLIIEILVFLPITVQAQDNTIQSTTSDYSAGLKAVESKQTLPTPSFPTFPSSPAQNLLPTWSVGNTGSSSYSGSFGTGNSYSGSNSYNNSFSSSGYNFPTQSGNCGVTAYLDAIGAKSGALSNSSSADLNVDAVAGRVGVNFSQQKCIDYLKIDQARSKTEIEKTGIVERETSRRRCAEAITEAGRLPPTPQSEKAMSNLMLLCANVMK